MARINVAGAGSESSHQKAAIRWWRLAGHKLSPGGLLFAIPNGGRRDAITGARLRDEGVLAGVPDLMLAVPAHGKAGLFIEVKAPKGGRVSRTQMEVMAKLEASGYAVAVAKGSKEIIESIERYLKDEEKI